AERTGGRFYGPVEQNPSQLPQIFIKEASIVRRSLIKEDADGIPVSRTIDASGSELMSGVAEVPALFGYVLTSPKDNPLVEIPLVAGDESDPIFVYWQTGLGKSVAWMSDARNMWAAAFVGSESYRKFWAQAVRYVSRPAQSSDYEIVTEVENGVGRVRIEALDEASRFKSDLTVAGLVMPPGAEQGIPVTLVKTGPGTYEGTFEAREEGNYVVSMQAIDPEGGIAALRGGTSVNGSQELLDLTSNLAAARRLAEETGGRVLGNFDASLASDLFVREWTDVLGNPQTLPDSTSPLPVWDWLIPILVALILVDVAIRRIAWDWQATKAAALRARDRVRMMTATTREEVDSLRQPKPESAAAMRQQKQTASRRFEAREGSTSAEADDMFAGASSTPAPSKRAPAKGKSVPAAGSSGGGMSSLMEAKRRARQKIEDEKND
ncbi:MAG: glutamine amidotransferase, partial [Planctomycetota bacterium]